jgi:hypothetical protein
VLEEGRGDVFRIVVLAATVIEQMDGKRQTQHGSNHHDDGLERGALEHCREKQQMGDSQ